jgi:hypothetical protein
MKFLRILLAAVVVALSGCVVVPPGPGLYYDYGYSGYGYSEPGYFYDYGYAWPSLGVVFAPGGYGHWAGGHWGHGGHWGGRRGWR